MKSSNRLAFLATAVVALSSLSTTVMGASATATSTATVLTPIVISPTTALTFGTFAAGAGGNVVVASTGNGRTSTGPLLSTSVNATSGRFTVTGANVGFSISAPPTVTLAGAGPSMIATLSGIGTFGTIAGGTVFIDYGGSLAVAAAATQTAGAYTGNLIVTVEYN